MSKKELTILHWPDLSDFQVHNRKDDHENAGFRKAKIWDSSYKKRVDTRKGKMERRIQFNEQLHSHYNYYGVMHTATRKKSSCAFPPRT